MNRQLARGLLVLYPRAWRTRYGAEVINLAQELISAGETTPLLAALNLIGGAILERGRVLAGSRRAALAMAVAAVMAVAGSFYATTHARPQAMPASLTSVSCVFRPGDAGAVVIPRGIAAHLKAGDKPGQFSRDQVPVKVVMPRKPGAGSSAAQHGAGPCVMAPALCRSRAAKPGRAAAPPGVRPDQCVVAAAELCRPVSSLPDAGTSQPGLGGCLAFRRTG